MRVIALTGSVAAGKTTVDALFRGWGATVIDADSLVRAMQRRGQPVFDAIVEAFGAVVVDSDGELDRARLRRIVLDDPVQRRRLEAIVHPVVDAQRRALVAASAVRGDALAIVDIPLLFEAGHPDEFDRIIVVDAPVAERRRRLIADRGLAPADADALIASQLPSAQQRERATWVIDNDGDRATLAQRTRDVWNALQA